MTQRSSDETLIRSYLLGELTAEAQERAESRFMSDGEFFEKLGPAEDDLVDEYVRGELGDDERRRFEDYFINAPARTRQVSFASALRDHVESRAAEQDGVVLRPDPGRWSLGRWVRTAATAPAWRVAVAAGLTVVLGGSWLLVGNQRLETELARLAADRDALEERAGTAERLLTEERGLVRELTEGRRGAEARIASLENEVASLREARTARSLRAAAPTVASVRLAPGLLRGAGETERLMVPSGSQLVRMHLELGVDDYRTYRAALHDAGGDEIWVQAKLNAEAADGRVVVTVTLPSELLPRGDYYVRLSGATVGGELELAGRYYFRVIREE